MIVYGWNNDEEREFSLLTCPLRLSWASNDLVLKYINNLDREFKIKARLLLDEEYGNVYILFQDKNKQIACQLINVDSEFLSDNHEIVFTIADVIEARDSIHPYTQYIDRISECYEKYIPYIHLEDKDCLEVAKFNVGLQKDCELDIHSINIPFDILSCFVSENTKKLERFRDHLQTLTDLEAEVKQKIREIQKDIKNS